MTLDSPPAIVLGTAGIAVLLLTKAGGPLDDMLRFRAKAIVGIAAVLAFIFFPWGRARSGR